MSGYNRAAVSGSRVYISLIVILLLQLMLILFFGAHKEGFHEDEYYSYYSSNRSAGLSVPDGGWVSSGDILRELTVQPGEGYNYALVHTVQSWDVHPPLFYDMLHTVCSMTPGVFSRWQGIAVNIAAFLCCFFLIWHITGALDMPPLIRLIIQAVWGCHPLTISCVMFIRMYMWLTVWILACALLHMRLVRRSDGEKPLPPALLGGLAAVSLAGALTHYYYLVFLGACVLCTGLHILLVRRRLTLSVRVRLTGTYGAVLLAALLLAVLIYPAGVAHILRGYRGREAVASFVEVSSLASRTGFFLGLIDEYLFGSLMWLILLIIVVLGAVSLRSGKRALRHDILLLIISALIYLFIISRTALLLGETSVRYELPVCPILVLLMMYGMWRVCMFVMGHRQVWAGAVTGVLFGGIVLAGLTWQGHVLFLYPEAAERKLAVGSVTDGGGSNAVVLYREGSPDHVWFITQELLSHDRLWMVSQEPDDGLILDEGESAFSMEKSDVSVIYVADNESDTGLDSYISAITGESVRELWRYRMWTAYAVK